MYLLELCFPRIIYFRSEDLHNPLSEVLFGGGVHSRGHVILPLERNLTSKMIIIFVELCRA